MEEAERLRVKHIKIILTTNTDLEEESTQKEPVEDRNHCPCPVALQQDSAQYRSQVPSWEVLSWILLSPPLGQVQN